MTMMALISKGKSSPTRNSFTPDNSFEVSKWDVRGVNLIMARSFLDVFERKGFDK